MGLLVWEEHNAGTDFPHAQELVTNAAPKVFIFLPAWWSQAPVLKELLPRTLQRGSEAMSGWGNGGDPSPRVCWLWPRSGVGISAGVLALLLHVCLVLDSCFLNSPHCLLWDQ